VLLGPVQRQIEFGQTRRSEVDGLPALQDRFEKLWAQEGEANQTPDVAPGDPVALGQLVERPVASSSNHVRPRTIALISAGSHRDLSFAALVPAAPAWFPPRAA
jgi:hypothetical protein